MTILTASAFSLVPRPTRSRSSGLRQPKRFASGKAELELENAKARVSPVAKKVFARFKACCAGWDLPALPAPPQAVAVFLTDKDSKLADIEKLAKHISLVHRAVGLDDPCDDILIRALLRQARGERKPKKGN
jgi:hypothetical protein